MDVHNFHFSIRMHLPLKTELLLIRELNLHHCHHDFYRIWTSHNHSPHRKFLLQQKNLPYGLLQGKHLHLYIHFLPRKCSSKGDDLHNTDMFLGIPPDTYSGRSADGQYSISIT